MNSDATPDPSSRLVRTRIRRQATWLVRRTRWWMAGRPGSDFRRDSARLAADGEFEEAAKALRLALDHAPDDPKLGLTVARLARYGLLPKAEAIAILSRIVADAPRRPSGQALLDLMNLLWERDGGAAAAEAAKRVGAMLDAGFDTRLRAAAVLVDAGRTDDALAVLDDLRRRAPDRLRRIQYLELVLAADDAGYSGLPQAALARRIKRHLQQGWDEYVARIGDGTDVAVVANGPQSVGSAEGPAIDGHRAVVRFNNFLQEASPSDLGRRVDIWFRPLEFTHVPMESFEDFPLLMLTGPNVTHRYSNAISRLTPYLDTGLAFTTIPNRYYLELFSKLDASPSSGLIGLYMLADAAGGAVSRSQVYGYSLGDNTASTSYYRRRIVRGAWPSRHHWAAEHKVYLDLVSCRDPQCSHPSS